MRKLIRRTVTIVITETWTIVWVDEPGTTGVDGEAGQGEVAELASLDEQPLFEDPAVDTEREVPLDAPVPSLLDDAAEISIPGDPKQLHNKD